MAVFSINKDTEDSEFTAALGTYLEGLIKNSMQLEYLLDSRSSSFRSSVNVNVDWKSTNIDNIKRIERFIKDNKSASYAANMIFSNLISDFVPYDVRREMGKDKQIDKAIEKYTVEHYDKSNRRKTDELQIKRSIRYTGMKSKARAESIKIKKKMVEKREQFKAKHKAQAIKSMAFKEHMVNEVIVDDRGITWIAPYANYQYEGGDGKRKIKKYQQGMVNNSAFSNQRGKQWAERAANNHTLMELWKKMIKRTIEECKNNPEDSANKILSEFGYKQIGSRGSNGVFAKGK